MINKRRLLLKLQAACVFGTMALGTHVAQAQGTDKGSYPNKPITLVVPYAPGGPADIIARQLGQGLTKLWGQPVVVDSRPGAGGLIALSYLARSPADGYTLGVLVSPVTAISPLTQPNYPYDPVKDFTPLSALVNYSLVMLAGPHTNAKTFAELKDFATKNPGKTFYGSSGIGGTNHLGAELISRAIGAPMTHVPYKGNAPAVSATMAGEVSFVLAQTDSAIALARGQKLTPLAITSASRNPMLPEVPTLSELGINNLDIGGWTGVVGPANLPPAIATKLVNGIQKVKESPEFVERMKSMGFTVATETGDKFGARIGNERDFWKKKITDERLQLQ